MEIFEHYKDVPESATGAVIAIGNFDGVHRGHQALLAEARAKAEGLNVPLGVLTFEPHPRTLFRPDDRPFRITPPALKADRLAQSGVDLLFSLPFNWDFASQSAEEFVHHILVEGLKPAHIFVGDDFRFGQLRKGDPALFEKAGIGATMIMPVTADDDSEKFSSSAIRHALRTGALDDANAILGWDWEIRGTVIHGDKRGRELGYPTANVPLGKTLHPAYGVYATWVQIEGEDENTWHPAATNIGIRPMFKLDEGLVEVHILDFDGDLYGKTLRIRPVKRLRGEAKFDSLDALIAQIDLDCEEARKIL